MNKTYKLPLIATVLVSLVMLGMGFSVALAATDSDDVPIIGSAKISESAALGIANKAYTGRGIFTDIELVMENGVLVFAIEYTEKNDNEVDVKVNANTGAVVLIESDEDELVDDDLNDTKEDDEGEKIANMHTLINLLKQLVELLRHQSV